MKQLLSRKSVWSCLSLSALLCAVSTLTGTAATPTISAYRADAPGGKITFSPNQAQFGINPDTGMNALMDAVSYDNIWGGSTSWTIQELEYDVDPIVYNNILMVNNDVVPIAYVVTVNLPTLPYLAPNSIRGSIDTSLIGTAAEVSAPVGGSIYTALIDGLSFGKTMQDYPFSLTTPDNATSSSDSFGYETSFTDVTTSIGVELRFTLSPGDTATIISDFEVIELIPEPTTAALLLLGGSVLFWRRRS